ncbi:MAG: enoyl-CoA hydratase-related protein [Acidobacteriota bacterium]
MESKNLKITREGGLVRLQLDRAEQANSLDIETCRELMHAAIDIDEDPSARAVLITAAGKMFCSGGDLASFASSGDRMPALLKEMTVYLHAALTRFNRMNAPVVAAVGGVAAGAGLSLACACDLVVAADSARFTMAYTRAGLTPDGSSTYFLPRIVGKRKALELMLTNRMLTAQEAEAWGIVNRVVPEDELESEAMALATQLAAGPTLAYGACKDLVLRSDAESLESQMEHESRAIAAAAHTEDAKEGIAAFFEKRAATFKGA